MGLGLGAMKIQKMTLRKSIAMGFKALQSEGCQEEFLGTKLSLCVK